MSTTTLQAASTQTTAAEAAEVDTTTKEEATSASSTVSCTEGIEGMKQQSTTKAVVNQQTWELAVMVHSQELKAMPATDATATASLPDAVSSSSSASPSPSPSPQVPGTTTTPMQSERGAYFGAPGEALRPTPAFSPSDLPRQETQPMPALHLPSPSPAPLSPAPLQQQQDHDNSNATTTSNPNHTSIDAATGDMCLVEAKAITPSQDFVTGGEATEVRMDSEGEDGAVTATGMPRAAKQADGPPSTKKYLIYTMGLFVILILLVALILGLSKESTTKDPDQQTSPQTQAPIIAHSQSPTPTTTATATATSPPTPLLIDNLPYYSLHSLQDPFSPQSLAMTWLEKHPNITNLTQQWRRKQLFALATIYYSMDGPNWPLGLNNDWLDYTKEECDWYSNLLGEFSSSHDNSNSNSFTYQDKGGSACNTENGQFIELRMGSAADFGYRMTNVTFPAELGLLSNLQEVQLNNNGYLGVATAPQTLFPPSVFNQLSTNLQELHLGTNQLNTYLPSQLGLLTNLITLKLSYNNFTGPIPSQLGLLTNLVFLDLQYNQISGQIPSQLGQLAAVKRLRLQHNHLRGTIPEELSYLINVTDINLESNNLSGTIPSNLGGIIRDNQNLGSLHLSDNPLLSGIIPQQLCDLQAPGCTYTNANDKQKYCDITFDCSQNLCGCNDYCPCPSSSQQQQQQQQQGQSSSSTNHQQESCC